MTARNTLRPLALSLAALAACGGEDPPPAARPTVELFTASPITVRRGQTAELSWRVKDGTSVSVTTAAGTVLVPAGGPEGQVTTPPLLEETSFALRAEGPGGRAGAAVVVRVEPEAPLILSFVADPRTLTAGQQTTLRWSTAEATRVTLRAGDAVLHESAAPDGELRVAPAISTTYALTARGPGGESRAEVMVEVRGLPPVVEHFEAQPPRIRPGQVSTLAWRVAGAEEVEVRSLDGEVVWSGAGGTHTATVSPESTTEYLLRAASPDGTTTARTMLVVSDVLAPSVDLFEALPNPAALGGTSTLRWETRGADRLVLTGPGGAVLLTGGPGEATGTRVVTISSTASRYLLEVENELGTDQAELLLMGHAAPRIERFIADPVATPAPGAVRFEVVAFDAQRVFLLRDGQPEPGFAGLDLPLDTGELTATFSATVAATSTFELVAVSAGGRVSAILPVVLGVAEVEPNESPAEATAITGSGDGWGEIASAGDRDVWALQVPDEAQLVVEVTQGPGGCALPLRLTFTSSDAVTVLGTRVGGGIASCARLEPAESLSAGTYFLTVESPDGAALGPYVLSWRVEVPRCGDGVRRGAEACDDGNTADGDGCDASCQLELVGPPVEAPGATVDLTFPADDIFRPVAVDITVPGTSVRAVTSDPGGSGCSAVDTRIVFTDGQHRVLGEKTEGADTGPAGTCAALRVPADGFSTDLAAGRYHVLVHADGGAGAVELRLELVAPACGNGILETRAGEECDDGNSTSGDGCSSTCRSEALERAELEPNDTQATANPTGLSGPGQVVISGQNNPSGDDDVFRFDVPAGQTLRLNARTFSTRGQPASCNSQLTDTRLFLEAAGVEVSRPGQGELAYNDDIDNAQNIWCSALVQIPVSGGPSGRSYYLRVQGWDDSAETTYFLQVTLAP